jgi:hypothetical protein
MARVPKRDSSGFGESGAMGILEGVSFQAIDVRGMRPCVSTGAVLFDQHLNISHTCGISLTFVPPVVVEIVAPLMDVAEELQMSADSFK